jgi:hypothetical protein
MKGNPGSPPKLFSIEGSPVIWVGGLIFLVVFLTSGVSGGFKALSRFGAALGQIPTIVWVVLILLFFYNLAMGGKESLPKAKRGRGIFR